MKELEEEIRLHSLDLPGMETFPGGSDPAVLDLTRNDFYPFARDVEPPTTPSNTGPPATPSNTGPPATPSNTGPPATPKKRRSLTLSNGGAIMKIDNMHQSIRSRKRPPTVPTQKISTPEPFGTLPPIDLSHEDWGMPKHKIKFVFEEVTQPPLTRALHTGAFVMKLMGCGAMILLALMLLSNVINKRQKKKRTRRGEVLVADVNAVEQHQETVERTPSEPREPGPVNNDSPPSYYECTLYSINEGVGEVPPPYTRPEHQNHQNGFVDNERRACSEDVAPEMRSKLVLNTSFDPICGRIIEIISFDANSNNNMTRKTSNDDVEKPRTHKQN
ncbi:hypothetical protein PYW08_010261 [Mythimna loreyi]|uniref:Uncharacterized protein n=1 Tax=Mythimna loreyi TaxID=667449 RepID=A0ACC2Q7R6_9NEOP|nr:hypothetical protein PYW08_010261 [Mythimna loreyi]